MMMSSAYLCDGDDGNEDDVDGGDDEDGGDDGDEDDVDDGDKSLTPSHFWSLAGLQCLPHFFGSEVDPSLH